MVMTPENITKFAGINLQTEPKKNTNGLFLGVYGQGGVGKTTILADVVRSEHGTPALLVDAEGGSSAVQHLVQYGLDIAHVTKWSEIQAIHRELKNGGHKYKTVIWDHLSEMTYMYKMVVAPNGIPEIQQWGKMLAVMMEFVRETRNLTIQQGMNVLYCAWEEMKEDKVDSKIKTKVNLFNSWAAAFPGMITCLGRVTVPDPRPPYIRKLSFVPDERTDAKFRISPDDDGLRIPLELYLREDTYFIPDLLAQLKDGIKFPAERYAKPERKNG